MVVNKVINDIGLLGSIGKEDGGFVIDLQMVGHGSHSLYEVLVKHDLIKVLEELPEGNEIVFTSSSVASIAGKMNIQNEEGLSDAKLRDMATDCFHIAPGFESKDIYYYSMFMYDDLMDDFTPLEQAYMDRSNFDVKNDEYFILTGEFNNIVLGLTHEEYTNHLRKHERTIVDYYTEFIK